MTPEQITLIKASWQKVLPIGEDAAELFYARLFTIDPTTRPLFRSTDMVAQRQKLLKALGLVVGGLERFESLLGTVQELGRRHAGYGVTEAHYCSVGAALLWTLEKGLGSDWTPKTAAAWAEAYWAIATVMRDAARTPAAA